ncbi:MAG: hypothetical protein EOO29_19985 [Comamonadaceae bacterium]|nr:MAG: hypothetical protein EOO29_19985 [Comamonadaceae bacterium]
MASTRKTQTEPITDLLQATLLGQYPPEQGYARDEYQIGHRLIWLRHCAEMTAQHAQEQACGLFVEAWTSMPAAVHLAEQASRQAIPDIWLAHDLTILGPPRLAVRGMTLTPDTGVVFYDIGYSFDPRSQRSTFHVLDVHEEDPIPVPHFPDTHDVRVQRTDDGKLTVVGMR